MSERRPEPSSAGPAASDGDEPALRKLATRLLAPPDPYSQTSAPPRVYVGRLPEDLSVELPIPDRAAVVGSAVRDLPRGRRGTQIMLDAALSAERFCEVHRQQLLAAGWNEDDDRPGRSGFVPRGLPMRFRAAYRFPRLRRRLGLDHPGLHSFFRLGARGPKLVVAVQDRQNAPTDIHLHLITGQRDPWLIHDPAWEVIPSLVSPPSARGRPEAGSIGVLAPPFGARELGGNWGGSGRYRENDGAYSFVALETDLDLAAHYAAQFEGAG